MATTQTTRLSLRLSNLKIGGGRLFTALVLLMGAGCTTDSTSNSSGGLFSYFKGNPYDQSTQTGDWFKAKPKDDDPKRTAMDDKARGDIMEAKRLYQSQDYAKAEPLFTAIAKAKKMPQDVLDEAMFYRGECQRLQGNYRDAEGAMKLYIRSFPYGKFTAQANERLFDIANYWLNDTRESMKASEEQREGKRTFVMPASFVHFGKDMPFTDVEGHALGLLEEVRLNDIRGKLAEKSLFYIATVKFFRADYKEADFYYSQIVEQYPKSDLAGKAMKQSIICKQIANGGTAYDTRLVEKCRSYLEEFARSYPGKDSDWIQKQLVSINHQQADRDFNIAEFYRRTGHPGSAYFYYELVRRCYPGTEYSRKAEGYMNDLRARVEVEQRTVNPDGSGGTSWSTWDPRRLWTQPATLVDPGSAAPVAPATTPPPRLLPANLGQEKGT